MLRLVSVLVFTVSLAACSTLSTAPRPVEKTTTTTSDPVIKRGQIAQCGQPGAPMAGTMKSAEWQARLDRIIDGGAGDELMGGPPVVAVIATDEQPIQPPVPDYPQSAINTGSEGLCEILMDVSVDGQPKAPLVACSRSSFVESAQAAAKTLRFSPRLEDGRKVERWNVVYPLIYCLGD